jgi:hypothetical protein
MNKNLSFGLKRNRRDLKRKRQKSMFKFLFFIMLIGVFAWLFFQFGQYTSQNNIDNLQTINQELSSNIKELEEKLLSTSQNIAISKAETKNLQERYNKDVPTGETKKLFDLMSKRIKDGVSHKRISYVLENVQQKSRCSDQIFTKRLSVYTNSKPRKTPTTTNLFNSDLIISAKGQPVVNKDGSIEYWFDPQKPVTLDIKHIKGQSHQVTGDLPFDTNFTVDDIEYRLNIRSGPRDYIYISGVTCQFP